MVKNIEYHCWRISSEVNSLYQIHTQQLAFCLPFVRLIYIGTSFFWALNTAFFFYFIQSIQRLTYYLLVVVQSCQYKWRILTGKISIECTYYSNLSKCLECMCGNIQKKPKYFQQVKNISIIMGTMHIAHMYRFIQYLYQVGRQILNIEKVTTVSRLYNDSYNASTSLV